MGLLSVRTTSSLAQVSHVRMKSISGGFRSEDFFIRGLFAGDGHFEYICVTSDGPMRLGVMRYEVTCLKRSTFMNVEEFQRSAVTFKSPASH